MSEQGDKNDGLRRLFEWVDARADQYNAERKDQDPRLVRDLCRHIAAELNHIIVSEIERSQACLHACEGLDTVDLAGNAKGWLAEVVNDAAKVEAELERVTADRDGLLVHQANLVGEIAGLESRIRSATELTVVWPEDAPADDPYRQGYVAGWRDCNTRWLNGSESRRA